MSKKSKLQKVTVSVLLGTLVLTSCKSPLNATSKSFKMDATAADKAVAQKKQADKAKAVQTLSIACENPIALDDVPADWKQVKPETLITGKPGQYQLESVVFHEEHPTAQGTDSFTATAAVNNRDQAQEEVLTSVNCADFSHELSALNKDNDILSSDYMLTPFDSFSQEDGSYASRWDIELHLENGRVKTQSTKAAGESGKFEATNEKLIEDSNKTGDELEIRYYAVSDEEVEVRFGSKSTSGIKQFMAQRYKLVK